MYSKRMSLSLLLSSVCRCSWMRLQQSTLRTWGVVNIGQFRVGRTTTLAPSLVRWRRQWRHHAAFLLSEIWIGVGSETLRCLITSRHSEVARSVTSALHVLFSGGAGIITWVLWNITVYSSPCQHPRITRQEKQYLASSTGVTSSITQVRNYARYTNASCVAR